MASFSGKWRLVSAEGVQAFQDAIHTPEEYRKKLRDLYAELQSNPDVYVEELHYDKAAGKLQRKLFIRGEVKRDLTVPIGVFHETTTQDGRKVRVKVTVESDTKAVLDEEGDTFKLQSTFEVHGQDLTLTNKSGNVVSTLKYKKA